jgi:Sec-independent protein translocase protein TatA
VASQIADAVEGFKRSFSQDSEEYEIEEADDDAAEGQSAQDTTDEAGGDNDDR